jgi:hypothetical protein
MPGRGDEPAHQEEDDDVGVLRSSLDTAGETYRANRDAQLALLDQLNEQVELAIAGGGPR